MYNDRFELNTDWVPNTPLPNPTVYRVVARSGACAWLRKIERLQSEWPGVVVNMSDDFTSWKRYNVRPVAEADD